MIEELGIIMFTEANECWKKARMLCSNTPNIPINFWPDGQRRLGPAKECEVSSYSREQALSMKKSCSSEAAVEELMKELVSKIIPESWLTINYVYLDHVNKENYDVWLSGG